MVDHKRPNLKNLDTEPKREAATGHRWQEQTHYDEQLQLLWSLALPSTFARPSEVET